MNRYLNFVLIGLICVGCSNDPTNATDVASDPAEDAVSDGDVTPDGTTYRVGDLPSGTIIITEAPQVVDVGDSAQLVAEFRGPDGELITDIPIRWTLSNGAAGHIDSDGLLTAEADSFVSIMAYAGPVVSEPADVVFNDPALWVLRTVSMAVEPPDALADRALYIEGPDGTADVIENDDGSVTLEVLEQHNQVAVATDADTGDVLMMRLFRGEHDDLPDEADIPMDMRSTAEALVFLRPDWVQPTPFALEGIRRMLDEESHIDSLAELLTELSRDGDTWANHDDEVAAEVTRIHQRLKGRMAPFEEHFNAPLVLPNAIVDVDPLYPQSELWVRVTACDDAEAPADCNGLGSNHVAVEVRNYRVRHVAVYFEPYGAGPDTTPPNPMHLQSATLAPSFWVLFVEWVDGGYTTFPTGGDPFMSLTRVLNMDPDDGGAEVWAVLAYGPGFGSNAPSTYDHLPHVQRSVLPWARTVVIDIGANLIGVFSGGIFNFFFGIFLNFIFARFFDQLFERLRVGVGINRNWLF